MFSNSLQALFPTKTGQKIEVSLQKCHQDIFAKRTRRALRFYLTRRGNGYKIL
jgi:hypothetical protein